MKPHLSKEIEWFRPYLKKVSNIVPVEELEKIIALKPRIDQLQNFQANLVTETECSTGKTIRKYISLNLYFVKPYKLKPLKRKKYPFSKVDLLETLAHELAHLKDALHTPAHKKLQNKICNIFMTELARTGYLSEEDEFKHSKPKF